MNLSATMAAVLAAASLLATVAAAAEPADPGAPGMALCDHAVLALEPAPVFGPQAGCGQRRQDFCARLAGLELGDFDRLADRVKAERGLPVAATQPVRLEAALSACGLDFQTLRRRNCLKAYRQQDLGIVGKHCPDEAWALARAQCERSSATVSGRYADFCRNFTKATP